MKCDECNRLERMFLESFVFADRAQTAMRIFLIGHQHFAGVSDIDEYLALRAEERKMTQERHDAYVTLLHHEKEHGEAAEASNKAPRLASVR